MVNSQLTTRRFHSDNRLSENFTEKGLQSLTGQPPHRWIRYIVKEVIDNSLEATEYPEITVKLSKNENNSYNLSIRDNGSGITKKIIYAIFKDINAFGGNKRHYKTPSRGNQGNALMTVLGIQNFLGHPLYVTSNNSRYKIEIIKNDIEDRYRVAICRSDVENIHGLQIVLQGDLYRFITGSVHHPLENEIRNVIVSFGELNPQASFSFIKDDEKIICFDRRKNCSVQTLALNGNTTGKAVWFSPNDFLERLKADFRAVPNLKTNDFVGEFYGLSSYKKKKAVLDKADIDGTKFISDFFTDISVKKDMALKLLESMQEETNVFSKRTLAKTLGSIGGKDMQHALLQSLSLCFDEDDCSYIDKIDGIIERLKKKNINVSRRDLFTYYGDGDVVETDAKVIPFFFEIIAVPVSTEKESSKTHLSFGLNQSFLYSTPRNLQLRIKKVNNTYIHLRWSFEECFDDLDYPFKVVCNLTCPNIDFQDKGKQTFDVTPFQDVFSDVLGKTIRKIQRDILPKLNKLHEDPPDDEPQDLPGKAPKGFIKQFVFDYFKKVYNEATANGKYTLDLRMFYYAINPPFKDLIKSYGYKYTYDSRVDKKKLLELNYSTFGSLVDEYERNVLGERIIYKSDRGFFVEPHSNKRVDLGTASVKRYIPDLSLIKEYGNLLFIEKAGFYELLHNDFKISKRYDLGLIFCKGYGTNAGKDLIEKIQKKKPKIKLFTLTDFDIPGLGIARNIKKPDELSAIDVFENCIRLGITIDDIEKYTLPPERVHLKQKMKTELENSYKKKEISKKEYDFLKKGQRVEINAFTPVEFEKYIIDKLKLHNVTKLHPEKKHLEYLTERSLGAVKNDAIKSAVGSFVLEKTRENLLGFVKKNLTDRSTKDIEKKLAKLYDKNSLYNEVIKELQGFPPKGWKEINREKLDGRQRNRDSITDTYNCEVVKRVSKILSDVKISVDFTNCNFCDKKSNKQASNRK